MTAVTPRPDTAALREVARQTASRLGPLQPCYGAGAVLALLDRLAAAEQRVAAARLASDAWFAWQVARHDVKAHQTGRVKRAETDARIAMADLRAALGDGDTEEAT